jgi:hypothetical protein
MTSKFFAFFFFRSILRLFNNSLSFVPLTVSLDYKIFWATSSPISRLFNNALPATFYRILYSSKYFLVFLLNYS